MTARIGYSSIIIGARGAGTSTPLRVEKRTRRSATSSPPSVLVASVSIDAPISLSVASRPARNGLVITPSSTTSDPGTINAAANGNAAEDGSAGTATSAHDVSDGGLLIALAEMAIAGGIGAQLLAAPGSIVPHAWWFGEDQARYLVTVPAAEAGRVLAKMKGAEVPCIRIGTTGGDAVAVAGEAPVSVASLKAGFEGWFCLWREK